jgi:hypothetical protein
MAFHALDLLELEEKKADPLVGAEVSLESEDLGESDLMFKSALGNCIAGSRTWLYRLPQSQK